jgi:hypothetical protein
MSMANRKNVGIYIKHISSGPVPPNITNGVRFRYAEQAVGKNRGHSFPHKKYK